MNLYTSSMSYDNFNTIKFTNGSIINVLSPSWQSTRGCRSEVIIYCKPIVTRTKWNRKVIRKGVLT